MSNILSHITYVFDRYKKTSSRKEGVVEMRISYNYKQKYISTGIMLLPKQWKKGRVVNRADAVVLNNTLDIMLSEDMTQEGKIDILKDLKDYIQTI